MDSRGYIRITDLGIARRLAPNDSKDTSGTPGYMAPEVICRHNHGIGVDYFALGILIYEFMTGRRPYVGRTRREIKDMMMSKQVQLKKSQVPPGWSMDAVDFTNKLIMLRPVNRLGRNGPSELKQHAWLRDFDWKRLFTKTLNSPYKPPAVENSELKKLEFADSDTDSLLSSKAMNNIFDGYDMQGNVNNNHDNNTLNV